MKKLTVAMMGTLALAGISSYADGYLSTNNVAYAYQASSSELAVDTRISTVSANDTDQAVDTRICTSAQSDPAIKINTSKVIGTVIMLK